MSGGHFLIPFSFPSVQAEARAEFAERSVQKLQKEVDRLEGKCSINIWSIKITVHVRISIPSTCQQQLMKRPSTCLPCHGVDNNNIESNANRSE